MSEGPRDYERPDLDDLDPDGEIFGGGFREPHPPSILGSTQPKTIVTWLLIVLFLLIAVFKPLFRAELPLPDLITDVLAPLLVAVLLLSLVPRHRKRCDPDDTGAQL